MEGGLPLPSTDGWPIPSLKPKEVRPGRQLVAVLPPDQLDAGKLLLGATGLLDHGLQTRGVGGKGRQGDVDVGRAERLLPVLWAALPDVPQLGGAGGHALPELGREAVERGLRHPQRLEALVREAPR